MDWSKFWNLIKPVIIIILAVIGYISAGNFVTRNLFVAIVALSFIFRGASIASGFVNLYNAIFKKTA